MSHRTADSFSSEFSYCNWISVLNYIEANKHNIQDKKNFLELIESYRSEHNLRHPQDIIRREDINPKIYPYLEIVEIVEENEEVPNIQVVYA